MDETIFGYICNVDENRREYVRCDLWTNLLAKLMSDAVTLRTDLPQMGSDLSTNTLGSFSSMVTLTARGKSTTL